MTQADRTLHLLEQLARNRVPAADFIQLLAPGTVRLLLAPSVAGEPQAQLLFAFSLNLLARLFPLVQQLEVSVPDNVPARVTAPRWPNASVSGRAQAFLEALSPPASWAINQPFAGQPSCALAIGSCATSGAPSIFAGSNGWIATVSPLAPLPVGGAPNPVGAYAAACLAVAEVTKRLLVPHLALFPHVPILPSTTSLSFSTYTYRASGDGPNPALPDRFDLGRLTLVGLGAGGGAVAYTLASVGDLRGILTGIDPDLGTVTNLNRLVMADAHDVTPGRPKTSVFREVFIESPELLLRTHTAPYREASSLLEAADLHHVIAAVDTREARRDIQFDTPGVLWDAGATEEGEFRIWRMILGETECMHCKHPPAADDPEVRQAEQLTALLGLDMNTWHRMVRDNGVFQDTDIHAIGTRISDADLDIAAPTLGQRFGDWFADHCGRLALPVVEGDIPIPFAPIMAGVLLAGEVIKERYFPSAVLDSRYWNTLLGGFMMRNEPYRRSPRANCDFCHDPTFLQQHNRRRDLRLLHGGT